MEFAYVRVSTQSQHDTRGKHLGRSIKRPPENFAAVVKDWERGKISFDEALRQTGLRERKEKNFTFPLSFCRKSALQKILRASSTLRFLLLDFQQKSYGKCKAYFFTFPKASNVL